MTAPAFVQDSAAPLTGDLLPPFAVDPASELPFTPPAISGWTEHFLFYGYDAAERLGVLFHIGRIPEQPEIRRGVACACLPDGGRPDSRRSDSGRSDR